jgi:hypothetical protein
LPRRPSKRSLRSPPGLELSLGQELREELSEELREELSEWKILRSRARKKTHPRHFRPRGPTRGPRGTK